MWLTRIEADRLRNLKAVQLQLAAGLSVVAGRNGQGKSSLLESIYLLGTGRSFRTRRNEELVGWGGGPLRVAGEVSSRVGRSNLTVVIDEGRRHLVADGGEHELEAYLGRVDLVDLTAERMKVLTGTPHDRRRFLDRGIVGLRPSFLRILGQYRRVLLQRNTLLRRRGPDRGGMRSAEIEAWDERIVQAAIPLHLARRQYAVQIGARLAETGRALFPDGKTLRLRYRPSPAEAGEVAPDRVPEMFRKAFAAGRERDTQVGHTCVGPHRDELRIELDDIDLRTFGSAGQVRAAMVALKLGKLSLLAEERGESPLFLMDDFDTDIDEVRARALAGFLQAGGFQSIVATSKESMVANLGVAFSRVRMDGGVAQAE